MPSARELLAQADALMRRNRAGMIDTEIPELRDIAMVAPAPAAAPVALDDVPELTEAVEEIEIESIVELPEDIDELSGWLHHDHGELSVVDKGLDTAEAACPPASPRCHGRRGASAHGARGRAEEPWHRTAARGAGGGRRIRCSAGDRALTCCLWSRTR